MLFSFLLVDIVWKEEAKKTSYAWRACGQQPNTLGMSTIPAFLLFAAPICVLCARDSI